MKDDVKKCTDFGSNAQIITEDQLRKLVAMSHNTTENEVDVLRFIKFGKQDLNTKVEWA